MFSQEVRTFRYLASAVVLMFALACTAALFLFIVPAARGDTPRAGAMPGALVEGTLQNTIVRVEPSLAVVANGETFRVNIMIHEAVDLAGFEFVIDYDPAVLQVPTPSNPVTLGPFLGSTGRAPREFKNDINSATGVITYVVGTLDPPSIQGPDGDGLLAFVEMRARALGTTDLDFKRVATSDTGANEQVVSVGDGQVVVAQPATPAQVSIQKDAQPAVVVAQDLLTYQLQRDLILAGINHKYDEILFDPLPDDTTYQAGSATLNGLPAPELYSATLNAIYYQGSGFFTDTDRLNITYQVQVGSLPSGTLILNRVVETVSFDGGAYTGPYTATAQAKVVGRCVEVTGVDLRLLTGGGIYTDTVVQFSADISPDDASKPFNYTIDYGDGTTPVTDTSSDDPLILNYTFATVGNHSVEIATWNCGMTASFTDMIEVTVKEPEVLIFLPLMLKED